MKKKAFLLYILCSIIFVSAQNKSKIISPESAGVSSEKLNTLNDSLHYFVDTGKIAGIQTAILRKGKLVHFDSYGYANLETKTPVNKKSIFRIFSMTKPITSVGLMQLYEKGKFKLEDPLYLYIPEFKNMHVYNSKNQIVSAKKTIRIIDLLRHTSGISYGRSPNSDLNTKYAESNLESSKNLKTFVKKISQQPLLFEPGTAYEYGHSTDICGYLIEVLSGRTVENYIKENILIPLKMNNTYFQLPNNKIADFTTGYRSGLNGKIEIAELPNESNFLNTPNFIRAGGGLVSTTNDYLNFCNMLINKGTLFDHQILKPETLALMFKDHLEPVRKHTPRLRILPGETGFGLGFSVAKKNGKYIYGWGGAVGTYFRVEPEEELAYIMMIQISPYRQLGLRKTFENLVYQAIIN